MMLLLLVHVLTYLNLHATGTYRTDETSNHWRSVLSPPFIPICHSEGPCCKNHTKVEVLVDSNTGKKINGSMVLLLGDMRDKRFTLVGDSLMRQTFDSLKSLKYGVE